MTVKLRRSNITTTAITITIDTVWSTAPTARAAAAAACLLRSATAVGPPHARNVHRPTPLVVRATASNNENLSREWRAEESTLETKKDRSRRSRRA
jgi:hypothetical protein